MKVRRALTATVLTAAAVASSTVVATPAQAAAGVSYCFKQSNGGPYASKDTTLYGYNGASWVSLARETTRVDGCGSYFVGSAHRHMYLQVVAQSNISSGSRVTHIFRGATPYIAGPGNYAPFLGTGMVTCTRLSGLPC